MILEFSTETHWEIHSELESAELLFGDVQILQSAEQSSDWRNKEIQSIYPANRRIAKNSKLKKLRCQEFDRFNRMARSTYGVQQFHPRRRIRRTRATRF